MPDSVPRRTTPARAPTRSPISSGSSCSTTALTALVTRRCSRTSSCASPPSACCRRGRVYGITRSDQFPAVGASAGVVTSGASRAAPTPAFRPARDSDVSYVQAGFNFGWELDVWGRLRRLSEAARAQYLATEEARRGGHHDAVARRERDATSRCARSISSSTSPGARATSATDSLRLTEARRERGVGDALDVRQAEQLLLHGQRPDGEPRTRDRAGGERAQPAARASCPATCRAAARSRRCRCRRRCRRVCRRRCSSGGPTSARRSRSSIAANARDRRREGRVLPAHQPHRLPRRRRADRSPASLTGGAGLWSAGARRGRADLQRRPHRGQRPLRGGGAARAGRATTSARSTRRSATSSDALAGYRKTTEQRAEQERLVDDARARRRGCRRQRYRGRPRQLPAGARRAAQPVPGRARPRAAAPAGARLDRPAVSRARRRVDRQTRRGRRAPRQAGVSHGAHATRGRRRSERGIQWPNE